MEYVFSNKAKNLCFVLMAIGLIAIATGAFTVAPEHPNRFWTNLMVNGFFFFGIALGALFFHVVQYASEAAWSVLLKRVFQGIYGFLPYGAAVIVLVLLVGSFHGHHMYHWMAEGVMDPGHENYDAIIAGKSSYLNQPFFWFRTIVYIATFLIFARFYRKLSLREDEEGGTRIHFKSYRWSPVFLILFAIFSSALAWDWIMSITPHWYSTVFGWYVFAGFWCSALIVIVLITLHLKKKGFLPQVNEHHIHDIGKWMFALSFLWTYLWFAQFMLIWYGNKPEEAVYFLERVEHYKVPFFSMVMVNFALPMIFLMSRDAKRNMRFLTVIGAIIFLGHWMDTFILFMPGTVHEHWHLGFLEIGSFLGFLGWFLYVVLNRLTKAPLTPQNHPFLEESVHLET